VHKDFPTLLTRSSRLWYESGDINTSAARSDASSGRSRWSIDLDIIFITFELLNTSDELLHLEKIVSLKED
jgi:hypothetical protein